MYTTALLKKNTTALLGKSHISGISNTALTWILCLPAFRHYCYKRVDVVLVVVVYFVNSHNKDYFILSNFFYVDLP